MSDFFVRIAWLVPFFPLLGAVRRRGRAAAAAGAGAHPGRRRDRPGVPGLAGLALRGRRPSRRPS